MYLGMPKAWDIVAYTFQADTWCPDCVRTYAIAQINYDTPFFVDMDELSTEEVIQRWGTEIGILPIAEESYDSGDFPKVVFQSMVEGTKHCGQCGEEI